MNTTTVAPTSSTRSPRPPLPPRTRTTAIALCGSGLAFASEMIALGPDLSVSIVAACVLVASALTATGWRWTPGFGTLVIVAITANNPFLVENLTAPSHAALFVSTAVNLACAAVAVVAGIAATVGNYTCRAGT